jgi:hypothetical protein
MHTVPVESEPVGTPGVHLLRSEDRVAEVTALADRLGGRVGLRGVLDDLDRTARVVRVPAPAASWGFRWDAEDMRTPRWWPQGITTSADAAPEDALDGRSVVVTSAYWHPVDGMQQGARLSFLDISDPSTIRYRHVLLVEPVLCDDGGVDVRPVRLHAGGIVWHGGHIHVAGTTRGLSSFRLDDIVRAPAGDTTRLRIRDGRLSTVDAFGYRYLLPARFTYDAGQDPGTARMRYSFASLDRSTAPHELVAGEYAHSRGPTRLVRYELDPATSLLRATPDGRSVPVALETGGVFGMQGATVVDGTWFVTTSRGRYRLGSLWVGRPGALRELRHQLPVGVEDISYWPERDELWSLSEYPGARFIFAMPRSPLLEKALVRPLDGDSAPTRRGSGA